MYYLPSALEHQHKAGDTKQRICLSALYQCKKKAHQVREYQSERITNYSKVIVSPKLKEVNIYDKRNRKKD
jgi:hypothetical protein